MPNLMRFRRYTRAMADLVGRGDQTESELLDVGAELLGDLLARDDWLPPALA